MLYILTLCDVTIGTDDNGMCRFQASIHCKKEPTGVFFSCSKQRANYAAILMSKGVLDIELVMDKLRLKF